MLLDDFMTPWVQVVCYCKTDMLACLSACLLSHWCVIYMYTSCSSLPSPFEALFWFELHTLSQIWYLITCICSLTHKMSLLCTCLLLGYRYTFTPPPKYGIWYVLYTLDPCLNLMKIHWSAEPLPHSALLSSMAWMYICAVAVFHTIHTRYCWTRIHAFGVNCLKASIDNAKTAKLEQN